MSDQETFLMDCKAAVLSRDRGHAAESRMILIVADLHLDMWLREGRDPFAGIGAVLNGLDALIIAGDLCNNALRRWPMALDHLGEFIARDKIWLMAGNHDYWDRFVDRDEDLREITGAAGAHCVQMHVIEIADTRIYCCTLWNDFALTGDTRDAMHRAMMAMPDYSRIRIGHNPSRHIQPADTVALHHGHLDWLTTQFEQPWHGKRIVVTHHAPSAVVLGEIDGLSFAFGSDLDDWIRRFQPDGWYFGHTHRPASALIHGVVLVNVSLGYPGDVSSEEASELLLRGLVRVGGAS